MRDRGERAPTPDSPTTPKNPSAPKPEKQEPKPSVQSSGPSTAQAPSAAQAPSSARQTAWDSTGGVSRAERSAAAMLDEPVSTDSGITLSVPKFYTLIAIALVLIVGAWAGGYQIGKRDGKDEMSRFVSDQPVVRPAESQPNTGQPTNQIPNQRPETTAGNNAAQTPTDSSGSAGTQPQNSPRASAASSVMTAGGYRAQDPRTSGMNYLVLATLPTEQAADAIAFMDSNGLTIIGVPQLDSRGSSANNPSRYTLYSLGLAIPGNRWSAMSSQRLEHQQMIASLGAEWQRERRGGSDFSQTNWEKYEP